MDIGTGKDIEEYCEVPVHLIDICPAGYKYNLFEFLRDFESSRDDIESRGKRTILCGGTGLYVESSAYVYDLLRSELRHGRLTQDAE